MEGEGVSYVRLLNVLRGGKMGQPDPFWPGLPPKTGLDIVTHFVLGQVGGPAADPPLFFLVFFNFFNFIFNFVFSFFLIFLNFCL